MNRLLVGIGVVVLLCACGGGTSSASLDGSGPADPLAQRAAWSAPNSSVAYFGEAGIDLVVVASATTKATVIRMAGQYQVIETLQESVAGAAEGALQGLRDRFIIFQSGGSLYRLDLDVAATTPEVAVVQVSSETQANRVCWPGVRLVADNLLNPMDSVVAYQLPGGDGQCGTSDDLTRAVRAGMDATQAPYDATGVVGPVDSGVSGVAAGWLVAKDGVLLGVNADFTNPRTLVTSLVERPTRLRTNTRAERYVYLSFEGRIRRVDGSTWALSEPLRFGAGDFPLSGFSATAIDEKWFYIVTSPTAFTRGIYRVEHAATEFNEIQRESALVGTVIPVPSSDRLAYSTLDGGGQWTIKVLDPAVQTSVLIKTESLPLLSDQPIAVGSRLFYNVAVADVTNYPWLAISVPTQGSESVASTLRARWLAPIPTEAARTLSGGVDGAVIAVSAAPNESLDGKAVIDVRSVDDGAVVRTLGTLPDAAIAVYSVKAMSDGPGSLIVIETKADIPRFDLYYFNARVTNSLTRLTFNIPNR